MPGDTTLWTIEVPIETDVAVRSLLQRQGGGDSALSLFVVNAVRSRMHDAAALDPADAEVQQAIERALQGRTSTEQQPGLAHEIEIGLQDLAAGRVRVFEPTRIVERGRALSGRRSHSS